MRWTIFVIVASLILGFDEGLSSLFAIHTLGGVAPRMVITLALFISLFGTRTSALWACWFLGVASDLGPRGEWIGSGLYLPGPAAIGLPLFCLLIMQLRGSVFRQRTVTIVVMTFMGSILVSLIGIAIILVRWIAPWIESSAPPTLLLRMGHELATALYSALLAIPLGVCLLKLISIWGFPQGGVSAR